MQPFIPHTLPIANINWSRFISLIGEANRQIARFDGILQSIPNPAVLLSPLTTQEAVLSSNIEWTQATFQEVLEFEANLTDTGKKDDIQEILSYRKAMHFAITSLKELPISRRLICGIHAVLLDSVRWKDKTPWHFRSGQVHIGWSRNIEEATFVPPAPLNIAPAFANLEEYINWPEKDPIVQLAIIHAQFEIIHPFWDGNGRIGRMLLPLFLYQKGILSSPMFYLSGYLEKHRDAYYEKLKNISQKQDWDSWIEYFLEATIEQSKINIQKSKQILDLYNQKKKEVTQATHSQFAIQALDTIFSYPIFTSTQFISSSGVKKATGSILLWQLEEARIIEKIRSAKWRMPAVYRFNELIKITG